MLLQKATRITAFRTSTRSLGKLLRLFSFNCQSLWRPVFPFLAFSILTCVQVYAQRMDTISGPYYTTKDSLQYKMEAGGEKWIRGSRNEDFQVFLKYKRPAEHAGQVSYYGDATLYWLNGVGEIELAAAGITQQNADSFIYHVTANDSAELVSWTRPQEFRSVKGLTFAYLGKFQVGGKLIKLEIYKAGNYRGRSVSIFNSLYLPAAQLRSVVINHNNQYLFRPYKQHHIPSNKQFHFDRTKWEKGKLQFNWSDSINHLAVEMEPTIQDDMYNVYLKRSVAGRTDTVYVSNAWEKSYYSPRPFLRINSSFFNHPGQYEILVIPEAPEQFKRNTTAQTIPIPFEVIASETTMFSLQQVMMVLGIVLLGGSLLFAYYLKLHRNRLTHAAQQQEIARLQLTSVRAQLNPHFMYNALAGIQNLINKNEISSANLYLSQFARITRNVLDEQKTEFVSITEEIKMLHDYLQMEQMRFSFQYEIDSHDNIDSTNTEIPAMLLQPFVENAVKHGIAPMRQGGRIGISLGKAGQNILVLIRDNGTGFNSAHQFVGKGLKLSKKRIELFNSFHKETPICLEVSSGVKGTLVSITLKNWL
ncbi:Histidine kinase [Cnuella takakiae]|uniref:Histidine kinase n=2 Tax=Cnuella takakiae TaxID=1302690 RepID=A0A1M4Z5H4_9BACT|nr:Histidine kinase [Cnuella takakiae]